MIGHFGDPEVILWLRTIANVHVFDTVGQLELAATVQAAIWVSSRIAIKPEFGPCHRSSSTSTWLLGSLSSQSIPPLHGVADDRVRLCRPDQWADSLPAALGLGRASEKQRLDFIKDVAWGRRMKPVVDAAVRPPT